MSIIAVLPASDQSIILVPGLCSEVYGNKHKGKGRKARMTSLPGSVQKSKEADGEGQEGEDNSASSRL